MPSDPRSTASIGERFAAGRIRVLYLIDKLHRAGTQVHLAELVRNLDRERFEPAVCCLLRAGPLAEGLVRDGIPVDELRLETIYGPRAWLALARLVHRLRRDRVHIVHTYLPSANVFGAIAGRMARVPVLIGSRRDTGISRTIRLSLFEEWVVNPRVDMVVAVCDAVADAALRERGLTRERVTVIPNGVDVAHWDPARFSREEARATWGLAPDEPAVGIVGHLSSPVKGHTEFLRAAALVVERLPRARFFVVGDGHMRTSLEELASSLGIGKRVTFTGVRADVPALLGMLDLGVVASHTEGMSNALLELMAMGLAVVATAVGGNLDLVDNGSTGLLVPARDPGSLAAAMTSLLADPARARAMGAAARLRATERFSLAGMVRTHEALYRQALFARFPREFPFRE